MPLNTLVLLPSAPFTIPPSPPTALLSGREGELLPQHKHMLQCLDFLPTISSQSEQICIPSLVHVPGLTLIHAPKHHLASYIISSYIHKWIEGSEAMLYPFL